MKNADDIIRFCWGKSNEAHSDQQETDDLKNLKIIDRDTQKRINNYYHEIEVAWSERALSCTKFQLFFSVQDNKEIAEAIGYTPENITVEDRKNQFINIYIELKNEKTKISFTPRHFLALKTAFETFREHDENE